MSKQNFTGSNYQNNNLVIGSGDSQITGESSINSGLLFSHFFRNFIDVSFGQIDISGNFSINNGNVLVNNNLAIG